MWLMMACYTCLQLNLNDHLGNKMGNSWTGSNHFIYTATNIRMDGNSPVLLAQMKNYDHDYVDASIELSNMHY